MYTLWVIGDIIHDVFAECLFASMPNTSKRLKVENVIKTPGGGLNTITNAIDIAYSPRPWGRKHRVYVRNPLEINMLRDWPRWIPSLTRLVIPKTKEVWAEFWDMPDSEKTTAIKQSYVNWIEFSRMLHNGGTGIVISDYNKGLVNQPPPIELSPERDKSNFKFMLVDSRYRTFDFTISSFAEVLIWHATGDEYNTQWAQNFDWVLWTNGPEDVKIIEVATSRTVTIPVPDTPVVDTTGAGDTFTAAVGVYLTHNKGIVDIDSLTEAVKFGVACAQTVITEPYTTISKLTLEEYLCTSQTPTRSSRSSEQSSQNT